MALENLVSLLQAAVILLAARAVVTWGSAVSWLDAGHPAWAMKQAFVQINKMDQSGR